MAFTTEFQINYGQENLPDTSIEISERGTHALPEDLVEGRRLVTWVGDISGGLFVGARPGVLLLPKTIERTRRRLRVPLELLCDRARRHAGGPGAGPLG